MDEQMQDPAYLRALDSIAETMDKCKCSLSENQRVILAGALAVWIPEAAALSQPAAADEVSYEIWQDDMMVAGASGPKADRAIVHYAAQYSQDGPIEVYMVTRRQMPGFEATP